MTEKQQAMIRAFSACPHKSIAGWVVRFNLADHADRAPTGEWIAKEAGMQSAERLAGRTGFIETVYETACLCPQEH